MGGCVCVGVGGWVRGWVLMHACVRACEGVVGIGMEWCVRQRDGVSAPRFLFWSGDFGVTDFWHKHQAPRAHYCALRFALSDQAT